jgi:hypothetical protein
VNGTAQHTAKRNDTHHPRGPGSQYNSAADSKPKQNQTNTKEK